VFTPLSLAVFFIYIEVFENRPTNKLAAVLHVLKEKMWTTLVTNWKVTVSFRSGPCVWS
jgi:hypothetical protein